jgi:hypothetical protein
VIKLEKKKIQEFCYSLRLKDITLSLLSIVGRFQDHFQSNSEEPNHDKILSWIIGSQLSQINEIMVDKEKKGIQEIYEQLNDLMGSIQEIGENLDLKIIYDKLRELSIKVMTNIDKISRELDL